MLYCAIKRMSRLFVTCHAKYSFCAQKLLREIHFDLCITMRAEPGAIHIQQLKGWSI